jgi:agmatine deiminase
MPAEWSTHEATWMALPPAVYEGRSLQEARRAWLNVANAVREFEPVKMLVDPKDTAAAATLAGDEIALIVADLDDAWARDSGPTFVRRSDGTLGAVDWTFNGWGTQSWASWQHDDLVARVVAANAGASRVRSAMVNEGGGIEVDGAGTVVITESVQRDPGRNPTWSRVDVERELAQTIGTTRVVWLERGLTGDYEPFGTRGHVDLLVKFVAPGVALYHDQVNPDHPDHVVSAAIRATLTDAGIEAVPLRAPATLTVGSRTCDYSYVNCYVVNGGVVLGTYGDREDTAAVSTLRTLWPGRRVVTVDARALFALGGGVHCITQQQPLVEE